MDRAMIVPAVFLSLFAFPVAAQEKVDLELVLLADASWSIDSAENRLQRKWYAAGITNLDVLDTIAGGFHRRIVVTYVEWRDENWQNIVVPWTIIDGADSAAVFAKKLHAAPRLADGPNAIGSAIAAGHSLIENNRFAGTRKVIDFSGDSASNWSGPR